MECLIDEVATLIASNYFDDKSTIISIIIHDNLMVAFYCFKGLLVYIFYCQSLYCNKSQSKIVSWLYFINFLVKMSLKLVVVHVILTKYVINIFAFDNNNINREKGNVSLEHQLKYEYGCVPVENWKLIKGQLKGEYIRNACIDSLYRIYEPPDMEYSFQVHAIFYNNRILEIDERKNSITILLSLWTFWHDPRIKVSNISREEFIRLPPITNKRAPIWVPFAVPDIKNLKAVTSVDGYGEAHLSLTPGRSVNDYISKLVFNPNSTIVDAHFTRKVEIFCKFDFSKYPFDHQYCPLEMKVPKIKLTTYDLDLRKTLKDRPNQKTFGGYDLIQKIYSHNLTHYFFGEINLFGFHNNFTRRIEAYIYQCYIPCIAIVNMSFSSFTIPLTAIPGRVGIIVTQFLALTSIFVHTVVSIVFLLLTRKEQIKRSP